MEVGMDPLDSIAQFYDSDAAYEEGRLACSPVHEAEFQLTADLLREYVSIGSTVLDLGCGPGRYSEFLIETKDCKVALVDLSRKLLERFEKRLPEPLRGKVLFCKRGSSTDLGWIESESFDHMLLMGPLYHLVEDTDRRRTLGNCLRILKGGGTMISSFISPFRNLIAATENDGRKLMEDGYYEGLLADGRVTVSRNGVEAPQFRCWPTQAERMVREAGFEVIDVMALEGFGSFITEREVLRDEATKEKWFTLIRRNSRNRDTIGASLHFSVVGRKKKREDTR
jgi:S-adenosylmethionine-dependent methyltransferase